MEHLEITAQRSAARLDKFLADNSELSRSFVAKLIENGAVAINGVKAAKKAAVNVGDIIEADIPDAEPAQAKPENIPLDIVYEDECVIVVNKPQGMVVHPAPGNLDGTLVNALLYHCSLSAINGVIRPGIVHRIDKDTSGLLVAAKTNEAHEALAAQLKERKALRKYCCIVHGVIKDDEGTIDKPIGRHPVNRKKMAVIDGGREAVTHFKVLERLGQYTLTECTLQTGRTHQIRVHMASVGHPIVGDPVYGVKKEKFKTNGQLLHAKTIGFTHPKTGKLMVFDSPLPEHFLSVLEKIRKQALGSF